MLFRFLLGLLAIQTKAFDYNKVADQLPNAPSISSQFTNIIEGYFRFWQTTDCLSILWEDNPFNTYEGCYFQNPNAPYGLMLFPPHEGEVIDKYYGFPISDPNNFTGTWHLKDTDVIVLLGMTPPKCKYFSFSNYLYSRYLSPDWTPDPSLHANKLPCANGTMADRCEMFASLDDSVNLDREMNLEPEIFNTSFALILSATSDGVEAARQGLIETGVDINVISNYSFPGTEMNLGIDTKDDTFVTIMRTAFYDNTLDASNYFNDVPYRVLRMELNTSSPTLFERRPLINRVTGHTDADAAGITMNEMRESVIYAGVNVVDIIMTDNDSNSVKDWNIQITSLISGVPDNGFDCIEEGRHCLADCRDTVYPFSTEIYRRANICANNEDNCYGIMDGLLTTNKTDVIIVVGINHALTNISSYASMAIYDANYLWGVDGIGNEQMEGTIWNYVLPGEAPTKEIEQALPYLYAYEIRRNCSTTYRQNCLEVAYKTSSDHKAFISLQDPVALTERMYNSPITHVGPDPSEVIMPVVIHMRRII